MPGLGRPQDGKVAHVVAVALSAKRLVRGLPPHQTGTRTRNQEGPRAEPDEPDEPGEPDEPDILPFASKENRLMSSRVGVGVGVDGASVYLAKTVSSRPRIVIGAGRLR